MAGMKFEDFSMQVKGAIDEAIMQYLNGASGELVSQTARNSPTDQGQLKNSWNYNVDEGNQESKIGSPLENAIWNEFGTGEYALEGNGRKGGWYVPEEELSEKAKSKMQKRIVKDNVYYFTKGKKPKRTFKKSYDALKPKLVKLAEDVMKGRLK